MKGLVSGSSALAVRGRGEVNEADHDPEGLSEELTLRSF